MKSNTQENQKNRLWLKQFFSAFFLTISFLAVVFGIQYIESNMAVTGFSSLMESEENQFFSFLDGRNVKESLENMAAWLSPFGNYVYSFQLAPFRVIYEAVLYVYSLISQFL